MVKKIFVHSSPPSNSISIDSIYTTITEMSLCIGGIITEICKFKNNLYFYIVLPIKYI